MKQYFSYFKILFIIVAVIGGLTLFDWVTREESTTCTRKNYEAPAQRVYDHAFVLSSSEEAKLEELIAKRESQIGCDIVIVTINESVLAAYGRTENTDSSWSFCMERYADDFYDQNKFGFDKVNGDGVLLLDNWYVGEAGSSLSTCGKVYEKYSERAVDKVLDDVYALVEDDPYSAYKSYIENVYREMADEETYEVQIPFWAAPIIAVISAGIFIGTHIKPKEGKKTTIATTYLEKNGVKYRVKRDDFVNKYVTSRVIAQSTGVSSGGRSSGRAGGRISSGGVRHGGGSRRR